MVRKKPFLLFSTMLIVLAAAVASRSSETGDYAGVETCMECHPEAYKSYLEDYHSIRNDPRTPAADRQCESCHGPGAVHVEEGDPEKIISMNPRSEISQAKKNAMCLNCHTRGKLARWYGSAHENRDLSCSSCHSVHKSVGGGPRPIRTEIELCTQCHKRTKAELLRQSHHPLREGKITCSDCHNPHGTVADSLVDAQYGNLKCFECHPDTRGPFLWPHPPVVEDCLTCHKPHGSTHDSLLTGRTPYLCQRCHSNTGHAGQLYARGAGQANQSVYRALNNNAFYRACLNCHINIHGSNHPSGKTLLR